MGKNFLEWASVHSRCSLCLPLVAGLHSSYFKSNRYRIELHNEQNAISFAKNGLKYIYPLEFLKAVK